jgi:hypothetical protein
LSSNELIVSNPFEVTAKIHFQNPESGTALLLNIQ